MKTVARPSLWMVATLVAQAFVVFYAMRMAFATGDLPWLLFAAFYFAVFSIGVRDAVVRVRWWKS